MTQTFTSKLGFTEKNKKEKQNYSVTQTASPSGDIIKNILNYSKSLDVKRSVFIDFIEIVKT